ncbi:hypothetical protein CROQUDRAFT_85871 [Cronartium quercuum f. sp. fusiforme G11]|uniref:Uncharacterized protein n=1 Tax=Cronartium quercuum f. sp. fusiforme G11 TaxID=708437 RepID=A0A9P6NTV7_9BASI|nr:hypothetical protein CROQUDRAFT_85871 [Cronartium quercuum f. sp. fusiforme G11]
MNHTHDRRTQLETWREIVDKYHSSKRPVSKHIAFIRKHVDKLDQTGFNWSKESIVGMLLQLGLPEDFPDSFDHVNDLINDRVKSSDLTLVSDTLTEEVIQAEEERMKSTKVTISDWPIDILNRVVELVHGYSDREARKRRSCSQYRHTNECLHREGGNEDSNTVCELPTRSLHALALVNKKIYNICLPWIWKRSSFPPTKTSIHIYIASVFPKFGSYIQELAVRLPRRCLERPKTSPKLDQSYKGHEFTEPIDCVEDPDFTWPTLLKIINQCPNLRSLSFTTPRTREYDRPKPDPHAIQDLIQSLLVPVSMLKRLDHLKFEASFKPILADNFLGDFIAKLPMLKSFEGWCLTKPIESLEKKALGCQLSALNYLSELRLHKVDSIDDSWCQYSWTQPLKVLRLDECPNLTPAIAYQFIHMFSATLSKLELGFIPLGNVSDNQRKPKNMIHYQYRLPSLAQLYLRGSKWLFISSFEDCKAIREICYEAIQYGHEWRVIKQLICGLNWPNLSLVDFPRCGLDSASVKPGARLSSFCANSGIRFKGDCLPPEWLSPDSDESSKGDDDDESSEDDEDENENDEDEDDHDHDHDDDLTTDWTDSEASKTDEEDVDQ